MLRAVACYLLLCWLCAPGLAGKRPAPYFDARTRQMEYAGPGRDDPIPDVQEVRIGYFGPSDPEHPEGGDLWRAASLAIEEANRAGGYRGAAFRLVSAWSENPWGTGVATMARMTYADGLWGVIGSINGAATHLAEQVVAKARLTLINPASTDTTVNLANVAWMFSCLPADDRQAPVLVQALVEIGGLERLTLISATDHDSRVAAVELRSALARQDAAPLYHLELEPGLEEPATLVERVAASDPRSIVLLAPPVDSARIVVALRERLDAIPILGGPSMGRRIFLEKAGRAGEGALFPLLCDPAVFSGPFAKTFSSTYGRRPDCAVAQTYDATRLLIAAIEKAGLNRARIRDAVWQLSPWTGVSGTIDWNRIGQNRRLVRLATVQEGRVMPIGVHGGVGVE